MATSAIEARVYESVRRHSPYPTRRRRRAVALLVWLALVVKVVVVGGFAFAFGFFGLVALRAAGLIAAGGADAVSGAAAGMLA